MSNPAQLQAIHQTGNVLLMAGAGTGKTTTLVERCLRLLEADPPVSLDEILMVTFTEASATDMRRRIREALEKKIASLEDLNPAADVQASLETATPISKAQLREQLALFDTAHIGTLHAFCLQLVRQHFYALNLDPQLMVMPEEEARLLANDLLQEIFSAHYAGKHEASAQVQLLIESAGGRDSNLRELILRIHRYRQSLRDPEAWLANQFNVFQSAEPVAWNSWLIEGFAEWHAQWSRWLETLQPDNFKADECLKLLQAHPPEISVSEMASLFGQIAAADETDKWQKKKGTLRPPLKKFFDDAQFLSSLIKELNAADSAPLQEDWDWARPSMLALLHLVREFGDKFSEAKRQSGSVDFQDLEQHSLALLWDKSSGQPSRIAEEWRKQFRYVFVDEYQDINAAQDAILTALSREYPQANRFLVGDIKQSIYRFRLAAPHIFQAYVEQWSSSQGTVIPLTENYRSRESILNFINSLFSQLMREEVGRVAYDSHAQLRFGSPDTRPTLAAAQEGQRTVELHLCVTGADLEAEATDNDEAPSSGSTTANDLIDLEAIAREARMVGLRLLGLKAGGHEIWDQSTNRLRPVEWRDMAILLRSTSGKTEAFAREFARLGVPLNVANADFYESIEISDLISLFEILDNPLQDVPLLAVLHSPIGGLSVGDLAAVRLATDKTLYWFALQRFHETSVAHPAWPKVDRFLKAYAAWRRRARQSTLSRCLQTILDETNYAHWLLTQPRGDQRHANVQRLVALAYQFDQFQHQGLFRFLQFIAAQKAADAAPKSASTSGAESVSLMTIHGSKGLEFPVVVVADLAKNFNTQDLNADIILDEKYGICPKIRSPYGGSQFPSLTHWLAKNRQQRELLGEELRLLYVALTRARDLLILVGTISQKQLERKWSAVSRITDFSILSAKSYLEWIAQWAGSLGISAANLQNPHPLWQAVIYSEFDSRLTAPYTPASLEADSGATDESKAPESTAALDLDWQYPHLAATTVAAKTSVSRLRRERLDADEEASHRLFKFQQLERPSGTSANSNKLSAADAGKAHHIFLQHLDLEKCRTIDSLRFEARRLELERVLSPREVAELNLQNILTFWQTTLGNLILEHISEVRRELEFTARFSVAELDYLGSHLDAAVRSEDFIIVQGVVDLAVILPSEIWLVDFKTDKVSAEQVGDRASLYGIQLNLYARALEKIYSRPVTQASLYFLSPGISHSVLKSA